MPAIYYHDKAILLSEKQDHYPEKAVIIKADDDDYQDLKEAIFNFLNAADSLYLYILTDTPEQIKEQVFCMFTLLNASGGLVINNQKQVLMIKRWGVWDFPKGKLEANEKAESGALREVKEETGVKAALIAKKPFFTYHIYQKQNRYILKQTWWFTMKASAEQLLTPQQEEDIEEVAWVQINQAASYLENSYASLKELWKRFISNAPAEMDF